MTPVQWVSEQLDQIGYSLRKQESMLGRPQYSIDGHPVVIRVSRCNNRAYDRWQWNVPKVPHRSIIILIAVDNQGDFFAYVIPWHISRSRTRYEITSHPLKNTGYMSQFSDNWQNVVRELAGNEGVSV